MVRKPTNVSWFGVTDEQGKLLDLIDFVGNNAWSRTGQTETLMPKLLGDCERLGLTLPRIKEAMEMVGYSPRALHQLERWESKRTTGKFGR